MKRSKAVVGKRSMKRDRAYRMNNFSHSQYFLYSFTTNCLALENRLIKGVKYISLSSI